MGEAKRNVIEAPFRYPTQVFEMIRNGDESGVSGTGTVLHGVVFPSGKCVIEWVSPTPSQTVFENFEAFKRVHIDAHPTNNTEILWRHKLSNG